MINYFIKVVRDRLKNINSKKYNVFVKQYYLNHRNTEIKFLRNIWNNNKYWDYYLQSFPKSIKSNLYVPYDYYNYKILPKLNDSRTKLYVQDKNMFDKIFGNMGVKLPKTIFRCMNGILMDINYNEIVDINKFLESINQDVIVKGTIESGGGVNVEKLRIIEGQIVILKQNKNIDLISLINLHKGNFIVQEVVRQHPVIEKLHPASLNTFKIMSYRSVRTNKVHILGSTFRMGINDSFVDNGGQGGISVGIKINKDKKAVLREFGFFEIDNYHKSHPNTKIVFKDTIIPFFSLVTEGVKRMSNVVPYQRLIGWDMSINEFGEPVLIEANYGSGIDFVQLLNGTPLFGKFSEEVKHYIDNN